MKKKKFNKKLSLNKEKIAIMNSDKMGNIIGGEMDSGRYCSMEICDRPLTEADVSCDSYCICHTTKTEV